ncbi:MAG: zinc-dependent alcohol dehydrogenase [bacterium]
MLVAYLVQPETIEIRDCPVPEPGAGEIVVRTKAALTCGTDLKAYLRGHALIPMPGPFGHEFSGVVHRAGKGVTRFRESDMIMSVHSAPCRECPSCKRGFFNLCDTIMHTKVLGAFSEYILLPNHVVEQNAYLKPGDLPFEEAAMLEPLACVVHPYAAMDFSGIETALILGAGPIGLLHLLFLRMKGIHVIVADTNRRRLAFAIASGAASGALPADLKEKIREETSGTGVDLVVECTGQPDVWESTVRYIRRGGMVILFGGCKSDTRVSFDTHRLHYDEIRLTGSFHYTPADVHHAYTLLSEKRLSVSSLISGRVQLRDIRSAFELLRRGEGMKYAILP